MFLTTLKRILKNGFLNFSRNAFVSLASVLVMVVVLLVSGLLIFSKAFFEVTLSELKDKVDVNIYFVVSAPEADIIALKNSLKALPQVKNVDYMSRDAVLADFKERHQAKALTLQALAELPDNPFGAMLTVKATDPSHYEEIASFLKNQSKNALTSGSKSIVDTVNFEDHRIAIGRLTTIVRSAEQVGFVVVIILGIIATIIVFNTIRLAIYITREEISVMRLVGASNRYIRWPFIVTGVLYGLVSGILTLIILYPSAYWGRDFVTRLLPAFDPFVYFVSNFSFFASVVLGSGIVLGAIGSALAVRRYLSR